MLIKSLPWSKESSATRESTETLERCKKFDQINNESWVDISKKDDYYAYFKNHSYFWTLFQELLGKEGLFKWCNLGGRSYQWLWLITEGGGAQNGQESDVVIYERSLCCFNLPCHEKENALA